MGAATICQSKKIITVNRAGYYSIRQIVRDSCGFMAELAASEALDNALRHGKHARATIIDTEEFIKLTVENDPLVRNHSRMENGGVGIKIIESLLETGAVIAFKYAVKDGVHRTVVKFPKFAVASSA